MTNQLHFPDLAWKSNQERLAVEVSVDFLPAEYENNWHRGVHECVADWVKKNNFKKEATLWTWAGPSVNLISRHPQYQAPTLSEFIVQFGLSDNFMIMLMQMLVGKFDNQVGASELFRPHRDEGWLAFCHIEQGRVWKCEDADTWEPFGVAESKVSRKRKK